MSVDLPGQNSDITPSTLEAGDDTKTIRRTTPITHGAGTSSVLDDDNEVYDALRELWRDRVDDPEDKVTVEADIDFMPGDNYVWVFFSSGYKAGDENQYGNWKQWFKYHAMLRRAERDPETGAIDKLHKPPTSVHAVVEPQKEGMTYDPDDNDGKLVEVDLPYGEGSRVQVQTTYVERPSQCVRRALSALEDVLGSVGDDDLVDAGKLQRESIRIWKLEAYLRFDIDKKHAAIRSLQKSENLINVGGGAEIESFRERQQEGHLEARVTSDTWHHLGVREATTSVVDDGEETTVGYERELKIYQASDWYDKPRSHHAHHPKMEASLGSGRNPHIDEWHDVQERLRELVLAHAEWAGIEDEDLIVDDYFKPDTQPVMDHEHPDGRREDLQRYYNRFEAVIYSECLKRESYAAYDVLSVMVEYNGATYGRLEAETGYSRSNLQYHVRRLKDAGLVETEGNPAVICFTTGAIQETAEEAIEDVGAANDEETMSKRRLEREERAKERTRAREEGEANGTESPDDPRDLGPESRGGDEDGPLPFQYLDDWGGTLQVAMDQLIDEDHPRSKRDIRIRALDGGDPGTHTS
jgi:DNA-binding transcriptional ArsR family regulator